MENTQGTKKFLDRWTPKAIYDARVLFREKGLKGIITQYGWKFFALFFIYYLVRDLIIYVFLPWYIANKVRGQF